MRRTWCRKFPENILNLSDAPDSGNPTDSIVNETLVILWKVISIEQLERANKFLKSNIN